MFTERLKGSESSESRTKTLNSAPTVSDWRTELGQKRCRKIKNVCFQPPDGNIKGPIYILGWEGKSGVSVATRAPSPPPPSAPDKPSVSPTSSKSHENLIISATCAQNGERKIEQQGGGTKFGAKPQQ